MVIRANWKMIYDNAGDGYHPSYSHQSLLQVAAERYGPDYDMQYFGKSSDPDDSPLYVQSLGNGHTFIDQRPEMHAGSAAWQRQRPQPGREAYELALKARVAEAYSVCERANWKIVATSQEEGYHVPYIHHQSHGRAIYSDNRGNYRSIDIQLFGRHQRILTSPNLNFSRAQSRRSQAPICGDLWTHSRRTARLATPTSMARSPGTTASFRISICSRWMETISRTTFGRFRWMRPDGRFVLSTPSLKVSANSSRLSTDDVPRGISSRRIFPFMRRSNQAFAPERSLISRFMMRKSVVGMR
jgi:hypothetical protein